MYLPSRQIKAMGRLMQTLAEPFDEREIRARVAQQVAQLLDAQFVASYVWEPARSCFDGRIEFNMDPANLLQYERYYQFMIPSPP